jgi:phenylacetate-CoA ligase
MLDKIKKIYEHIPKRYLYFLKHIPNNILFGKDYIRCKSEVTTSTNLLQNRLYSTLVYARDNTIFWSKLIPAEFKLPDTFPVFNDLPFIGPGDLLNEIHLFVSKECNKNNSYRTTTGGTGRNPTTLVLSNESYALEWAHMYSLWGHLGYERTRNIKLTLRGTSLKNGRLYAYNPMYNEIVIDTFQMDKGNFPIIFKQAQQCEYIHGYPSLVKEFKNLMEYFGYRISFRGIFLGSEGVDLSEKLDLQSFFGCGLLSWYGQSEKVVLAADYECNNSFHVLTSYGYPCTYRESNYSGEIAGTTFVNKALPLIKYRTGDYGRIELQDNKIVIKDLIGRWGKDFVYLNKDKKIPTTSINLHSEVQQLILLYQIHQNEYGKLKIKVLPKSNVNISDETLINRLDSEIGSKLQKFAIVYEIVKKSDEFIKSPRGKFILLVQDLPAD